MPTRFVRLLGPVIACLLFTGGFGRARAQAPATLSPDRVTFYTEPNYKGEALTIEAGASVENLDRLQRPSQKPWTFAISSVRVEGAAKATVFSGGSYSGDRLEISRDIPDLYGQPRGSDGSATWDRAIASIAVVGPPRTVVTQPTPPPTQGSPPNVVIVPTPAPPPPIMMRPPPPRLDRRSAEIIVQRAYREVLRRPADPEGLRTYRDRLMFQGWTEQQIIQQLQRSSEARNVNADEAIARAYREVLGRDPDAGGLAHYRAKWRDGWTQGQIRDDLRRSHEGRNNHIHAAITRAYRDVLGRDPDPGGYANYERLMRERGYSERDVRQSLQNSQEFREKRSRR